MKALPSWDEAVAILAAHQERLTKAAAGGTRAYERAFRESPPGVGVHEIDVNKIIRRVNPEEQRLLGYGENELVGRPILQFIVMQEASQRSIEKKLAGARTLAPFVRTFVRADGSAVSMLLLDCYLTDRAGQITGIRTAIIEVAQDARAAQPRVPSARCE